MYDTMFEFTRNLLPSVFRAISGTRCYSKVFCINLEAALDQLPAVSGGKGLVRLAIFNTVDIIRLSSDQDIQVTSSVNGA